MLGPGDTMADFEYVDAAGVSRHLSEVWRDAPAWLLWMRHCGCVFFAEAMKELGNAPASRVSRICILQAGAAEAQRFCAPNAGCAACVPDPKRLTFAAIGLGRTTLGDILKPSLSVKRRRVEAKVFGVHQNWLRTFAPGNDVLQLPGAALVARGGRILFVHRGEDTGDQLNSELLDKLAVQYLTG